MHTRLKRLSFQLMAAYIVLGGLWIVASDALLAQVKPDPVSAQVWGLAKGFLFIFVTGLLLYRLLRRHQRELADHAAELQRREQNYALLFAANPEPMWVLDGDSSVVLETNQAALDLYGYPRDRLLGMRFGELRVDGAGRSEDVAGASIERHRTAAGSEIDVELFSRRIAFGGRDSVLVLGRNVSAYLDAQRQLVESSHRLETAQRIARLGNWTLDPAGERIVLSDEAARICGVDPQQFDGRYASYLERVHPDDLGRVRMSHDAVRAQQTRTDIEYRIRRPGGQLRWVNERAEAGPDGAACALLASVMDVTERKWAEQRLEESEERYRFLLDSTPDGIFLYRDQRFFFSNQAGMRLLGIPSLEALMNYALDDFGIPSFEDIVVDRVLALRPGKPLPRTSERLLRRTDGVQFEAELTAIAFNSAAGPAVQLILRDVTERNRARRALEEANERLQRLSKRVLEAQEAERRWIANELHDEIGQVLTAVKLRLQALKKQLPESGHGPKIDETVRITEAALQQIRDLSMDLRPPQLQHLGLVPALRWMVERQHVGDLLEIRMETDAYAHRPGPEVEIVCFRVAQEAVTNTVKHARARRLCIELSSRRERVDLLIADDGVGFDPERAGLGRPPENGEDDRHAPDRTAGPPGIGLVSMHERAALVGGHLDIESGPGRGTIIRLAIPLNQQAPTGFSP